MKIHRRILSLLIVMMMLLATIQLPVSAGSPFRTHFVPGDILAAEFDFGEQGETYSGITTVHEGKSNYRGDGAIMNVHNNAAYGAIIGFNKGEWMKYTFTVKETGTYNVIMVYDTIHNSGVKVSFDDASYEILSPLPPTGAGWGTVAEYDIGSVTLSEGVHTMIVSKPTDTHGFNFCEIKFEEPSGGLPAYAKQDGSYRATTLPAIIQAEDFDLGSAGSISSDDLNDLRKYRVDDKLDIGIADVTYLHLNKDEAAYYTVNVDVPATYSIDVNTKTYGSFELFVDDAKYPINVNSKVENGYDSVHAANLYLDKGEHKFKIATTSVFDIDYLKFLKTDEEGITVESLNYEAYPPLKEEEEVINPVWKELYVSTTGSDSNDGSQEAPFATIERAAEEVAAIRGAMEGDIIVNIGGGTYMVDETIKMNETNGGANGYNVVYRGDANDKPVFNGGTEVTGWEKDDEKVWKAPLDVEATRTLYVGQFAAQRARSKYKYYGTENYMVDSQITDGFKVNSRNFPRLAHPEDAELVWELEWQSHRTPLAGIDYDIDSGEAHGVRVIQPLWSKYATTKLTPKQVGVGSLFHIENAKELLDEPGEFFYDQHEKQIYYYPYKAEDMTTIETWVGTTDGLLEVHGQNKETRVDGIRFENLEFKYGSWNEVTETGMLVNQADQLKDTTSNSQNDTYMMPSQLDFKWVNNVQLTGCTFEGLGSNGIGMNEGVTNAKIDENVFLEISGCAISLDANDHDQNIKAKCLRTTDVQVTDNIMWRIAHEFRGCPAIMAYFVKNVTIEHNDIRNVAYSAVSVGWGWQSTKLGGIMLNNHIAYNSIHDNNYPAHDGAQIYTLGEMQGVTIHDNYLTKGNDYRGGIYLDEGSKGMEIFNNVVADVQGYWFCARPGVSIDNCTAYNNFSDTASMWVGSNIPVENTTVCEDENWPSQALKIIEKSGILDKSRLEDVDDVPEWRITNNKTVPMWIYYPKHTDIVQAEDFLDGWNVGYYNIAGRGLEASTIPTLYREFKPRTNEVHADIWITPEADLHNFGIGNTEGGDWFAYEYDVPADGDYTFQMRFVNGWKESDPQPKVSVYVDGIKVINQAQLGTAEAGNWNPRFIQEFGTVNLTAGKHNVKIEMVDNGWHFDWWSFTQDPVNHYVALGNEPEYDEGVYVEEGTRVVPGEEEEYISKFVDIKGHWAETYINSLAKSGIVNGISETEFAPERSLTLYETTWLSLRTLGVEYTDDNWKQLAVEKGLLTSVNEADGVITRERFAYNVMNAYKLAKGGYNTSVGTKIYTDMDQISPAYEDAVRAAKAENLLTGDDTGTFRPQSALTRAEAVTVFYRMISAGM